ncbi:MAG TPA: ComEC/Rec2 family competence protein [Actinomycetota bacterium]|nr:ComEC/Rec2 family competence protein [Actinomycetota bacterium]
MTRSLLGRTWLVAAALAAGASAGAGAASTSVAAALAAIGLVATGARRRPAAALGGIAALAVAAGALAAHARATPDAALATVAQNAPRCRVHGVVHEDLGGLGALVLVRTAACGGRSAAATGLVAVDEAPGPAGAAVAGEGLLVPLGDDAFDDARRRAGALAHLVDASLRTGPVRAPVLAVAAALRAGLGRATAALPARPAALLRGVAVGDTGGFDPVTIERFRRAGLTHLLAVSGGNVAIVLCVAAALGRRLGRRTRLGLAAASLALFVLVVGPEPSVVRAATMAALALAAAAGGHRAEPLRLLGVALVVAIALRPGLASSAGLHLSAAATAGIVLWAPPLERRLRRRLPRWAAAAVAVPVAAQAAAGPLVAAVFGEVSLTSPVANLAALPAVAPATVAGLAAAVAGALAPGAGAFVARAAEPLARWILGVADVLGAPRWAALEVPPWAGRGALAAAVCAAVATAARRDARPSPARRRVARAVG